MISYIEPMKASESCRLRGYKTAPLIVSCNLTASSHCQIITKERSTICFKMQNTLLFLVLSSLLVTFAFNYECTGASYVDVPYDPSGDCYFIQLHIATTYDAVSQTTSTTYYSDDFKTLYVSEQLDDTFDLYDYNQGLAFHYEAGVCITHEIMSGEYTLMQLLDMAFVDWDVEDFNGMPSRAYTIYDHWITTKGLMRWDCMETATYIYVGTDTELASFHTNFLNVNVEDCITYAIEEAEEKLSAITCDLDLDDFAP